MFDGEGGETYEEDPGACRRGDHQVGSGNAVAGRLCPLC